MTEPTAGHAYLALAKGVMRDELHRRAELMGRSTAILATAVSVLIALLFVDSRVQLLRHLALALLAATVLLAMTARAHCFKYSVISAKSLNEITTDKIWDRPGDHVLRDDVRQTVVTTLSLRRGDGKIATLVRASYVLSVLAIIAATASVW